jgi:hypothetical protein
MKTIKTNTKRPLRVPLPRGKTIHLGPAKTGQITVEAAEYAGLKKLVAAGDIEVVDEASEAGDMGAGGPRGRAAQGHTSGGGNRRSGDR